MGLGYIAIIGLAKKFEEVFIPTSSYPQSISKTSSSIYLLRTIRDEVHRYSITFHRKKRIANFFDSTLSNIKGLGEKRIKLLWNNYDSFEQISKDKLKNINNKTGIPIKVIKSIKVMIESEKDLNE